MEKNNNSQIITRNTISLKQMALMTFATQIGLGTLTLPSVLAKKIGHDGWMSILVTGVIVTFAIIIMSALLKRYSDKSLLEINKLLYGKALGSVFNIFIIIYLFAIAAQELRFLTTIINILILKVTPPLVLTCFVLLPSIYLLWYGLKPIARYCTILFFIMPIVFILFAVVSRYLRLSFLMPVGQLTMSGLISSMKETTTAYLGFEYIPLIYPFIQQREKTLKYSLIANITSAVFFLALVLACTAFFGEVMLQNQIFPLLSLARSYKAPTVERLDLFFLGFWLPVIGCSLRVYLYSACHGFNTVFNLKKNFISFGAAIIALVLCSRIPRDYLQLVAFKDLLTYVGIVYLLFFIISYIFSFINKKGVKVK